MGRPYAYGVSFVTMALVLLPLATGEDSFPLSTYPMFSANAVEMGLSRIVQATGIRPDGSRVTLPPGIVANDEVLQAHRALLQAVRQGPLAVKALCRDAAERVRASSDPDLAGVAEVEIATHTYDAVDYFSTGKKPVQVTPHHRCKVP